MWCKSCGAKMARGHAYCKACGAASVGATTNRPLVPGSTAETPISVRDVRLDALAEIKTWNMRSIWLFFGIVVGARVYQSVARGLSMREETMAVLGAVVFIPMIPAVGYCIARMKGRNGWWGVLGALGCIGWAVLYMIGSKCRHCGTVSSAWTRECKCGFPVSVRWKPDGA